MDHNKLCWSQTHIYAVVSMVTPHYQQEDVMFADVTDIQQEVSGTVLIELNGKKVMRGSKWPASV